MKKDKITTTLAQIRAHSPCENGWEKLCENLGGLQVYGVYAPLTFKQIYDSNGYDDTLWCLQSVNEQYYPVWRHFAVDCAEQVKHLMTDERSLNALVVARKHADGKATSAELAAAGDAAWVAAWVAARAAAGDAAWVAARAAAWAAARAAAWDAAWVAARAAAWAVAKAAAGDANRAAQIELLFQYCRTGERVVSPDFSGKLDVQ